VLVTLAAAGRNPTDITLPTVGSEEPSGGDGTGSGSGSSDRMDVARSSGPGAGGANGSGVLVAQGALTLPGGTATGSGGASEGANQPASADSSGAVSAASNAASSGGDDENTVVSSSVTTSATPSGATSSTASSGSSSSRATPSSASSGGASTSASHGGTVSADGTVQAQDDAQGSHEDGFFASYAYYFGQTYVAPVSAAASKVKEVGTTAVDNVVREAKLLPGTLGALPGAYIQTAASGQQASGLSGGVAGLTDSLNPFGGGIDFGPQYGYTAEYQNGVAVGNAGGFVMNTLMTIGGVNGVVTGIQALRSSTGALVQLVQLRLVGGGTVNFIIQNGGAVIATAEALAQVGINGTIAAAGVANLGQTVQMSTGGSGSGAGGAAPERPVFGRTGVQTPSKTVYNKGGVRVDFENPNPGQRPGQIHVQVGDEKILYDPLTGTFPGAAKSLRKILESPEVQGAVQKALRMLGENG
jgi:filamentous hemagglutinin